ncbi:uncharacterized protein KY384_006318 [Bacidia gigantensis]|uniref:uncharacterized protein n=1 Tax=Bacidia gigantensis TaxID=2732470 RepID=UPI001D0456C9|nr:uncharacterized protein KY384_006318 [Bacidia gigantensis]KAG8528631.1 hypothetical protein KY384_006318 [Bacidia gigantensis]
MAFRFGSLPREIRDMIYKEYFDLYEKRGAFFVNVSITILLLNRQIHEEAVQVLYSTTTFYFNDELYGAARRVEAQHPCRRCKRGPHQILVLQSDYLGIHEWLQAIGQRNRDLIRSVQMYFIGARYTKARSLNETFHHHDKGLDPQAGADLQKAVALLSKNGGHLKKLKITMAEPHNPFTDQGVQHSVIPGLIIQSTQKAFRNLFLPNTSMQRAFGRFRGLTSFEFGLVGTKYLTYFPDCTDMPGTHWTEGRPRQDLMKVARRGLKQVREQVMLEKV